MLNCLRSSAARSNLFTVQHLQEPLTPAPPDLLRWSRACRSRKVRSHFSQHWASIPSLCSHCRGDSTCQTLALLRRCQAAPPARQTQPCVNPAGCHGNQSHGFHGNCFILPAFGDEIPAVMPDVLAKYRWGTTRLTSALCCSHPGTATTHSCTRLQPVPHEPLLSTQSQSCFPQAQGKITTGFTLSPKTLPDRAQHWENGARVSL